MDMRRGTHRELAAAERGHIIQRVLVDGWTPAEAAIRHNVPQRQVVRWVAEYRRKGMASLHDHRAGGGAPGRFAEWLRARLPRIASLIGGQCSQPVSAPCIVLRRTGELRRPR